MLKPYYFTSVTQPRRFPKDLMINRQLPCCISSGLTVRSSTFIPSHNESKTGKLQVLLRHRSSILNNKTCLHYRKALRNMINTIHPIHKSNHLMSQALKTVALSWKIRVYNHTRNIKRI